MRLSKNCGCTPPAVKHSAAIIRGTNTQFTAVVKAIIGHIRLFV